MEAIVLAGGLGTRLRGVVDDVPKPMAPIGDRPFLEVLLSSLAKKGFSKVVVSVGFKAGVIIDYFGDNFEGMEIAYAREEFPLGTGGALRLALEYCSQDRVFVFNGDTYLDIDIEALNRHLEENRNLVVVGRSVPDTSRFGRLIVEGSVIKGLAEKGVMGRGLINAGCYVLSKKDLVQFPINVAFSFENDFLAAEITQSIISVFVSEGLFIDIGVPADYKLAQALLCDL